MISPLLANIALSVLDEHFTAAWAAMGDSSARRRLSDEKTRICHIDDGFDFLGFRIQRQPKRGSGKPTVYTWPTKKALCTVKAKVGAATRQGLHQPLAVLLYRLAPILRGWTSYFRQSTVERRPVSRLWVCPRSGGRDDCGRRDHVPDRECTDLCGP